MDHVTTAAPGEAPVDLVSGAALMAHCAAFAERTKLSGTPDELASMRLIQEKLDGFGYRTTLLSHDAFISLPGPARVEVDGQAVPAITHSFSVPSPGLSAPVAYVGDGSAAGFAGRDLRGCIVLAEGIEVKGAWLDNGLLHIDLARPQPEIRVRTIEITKPNPTGRDQVMDSTSETT